MQRSKLLTFYFGVAIPLSFSLALLFGCSQLQAHAPEASGCDKYNLHCISQKMAVGAEALQSLPTMKAEIPAPARQVKIVTYSVETRGTIASSLEQFKAQANETLNDGRGWMRMGVHFQEVATGGQFTLVLSEASQVPTFSSGCDSTYSCNVGRFVIINQDRWNGATAPWNAAGGSLRDYRHMVVNHETGHWLGHGHIDCQGAGQSAPVMQQQSIDLQGCTFNPWPLESELHSSRLGL